MISFFKESNHRLDKSLLLRGFRMWIPVCNFPDIDLVKSDIHLGQKTWWNILLVIHSRAGGLIVQKRLGLSSGRQTNQMCAKYLTQLKSLLKLFNFDVQFQVQ